MPWPPQYQATIVRLIIIDKHIRKKAYNKTKLNEEVICTDLLQSTQHRSAIQY